MNILLGTHNVDKAILLESLLLKAMPDSKIHLLSEFQISERVRERGSLLSRATSKAFAYEREILDRGVFKFDLFIGVDDGIYFEGQTDPVTDSKSVAKFLLKGAPCDGIEIMINHAIAIVSKDHKCASFVVSIPMIYKRPKKPVKFIEGRYPLTHVLRIPGCQRTLSRMPYSQCIDYYWSIVSSHLIHALRACGSSLGAGY